jgi:hypothetical protein
VVAGRFTPMTPLTEYDVAVAAHFMGYDLWRSSAGYVLKREWHTEAEIFEADSLDSLESIADFLKH